MKLVTKRLLGIAAASALVVGATTGVFAHGGFGPGWNGHHRMMGGPGGMHGPSGRGGGWMMGQPSGGFSEQGLAQLKSTLGITADQESAWEAYAEAVKGKANLVASHRQAMFGAPNGLDPSQRQAFHQEGWAQMQTLRSTASDLYAVLTPDQRVKAGELIPPHIGQRLRQMTKPVTPPMHGGATDSIYCYQFTEVFRHDG